jgi:hypothetical protein
MNLTETLAFVFSKFRSAPEWYREQAYMNPSRRKWRLIDWWKMAIFSNDQAYPGANALT